MSKLKFEKKQLVFEWDGKEYILPYPTFEMKMKFEKNMGLAQDEESKVSLMFSFFEEIGLPKSVAGGMYDEHLKEIIDILFGLKKNNQK